MTNSNLIKIVKGSTRIQVIIDRYSAYLPILRDMLKRKLTDYVQDPRTKQWEVGYRYFRYDRVTSTILLPVSSLALVTDELDSLSAQYIIEDEVLVKGRDIHTKMVSTFKPREAQLPVIDVMTDSRYRVGISTATGSGKTISTLASIVKNGKCAMVIVSGLTDQWVRQALNFTNVGERVVLVQGIQSLMRLMEQDAKPDIIVFSLETLRRYVNREENYQDLPPYEKFIEYFGVDMKIVDECHMNFHAITIIDLYSNIRKNIYLTATFTSSNPQTRRIFNMVYPESMIYGANIRKRYIRIWSYTYRMFVPEKAFMRQRGYSHIALEKYLYKRPHKLNHFFETVLYPIVNSHYESKCEPGQKCLVYFETINMVMAARQWFEKTYPNRKVGVYIGGSEDEAYNKYEIICTTPGKAGVGTDIKNLYVLINTISFKSVTLAEQMPGRLRELPDGTTPEFIELVNSCVGPQMMHRVERRPVHLKIAYEYKQAELP